MKNRAGIQGLFKGWGHGPAENLRGDHNLAGLKACQQFGHGASPLKKKKILLEKDKVRQQHSRLKLLQLYWE